MVVVKDCSKPYRTWYRPSRFKLPFNVPLDNYKIK